MHAGLDDDADGPDKPGAVRTAEEINQHELMDALRSLAGFDDNPFLRMQAFNLGIVDAALNDLEQFVLRHQLDDERPLEQIALLGALSQMWIFAAYELVRTWRQRCAEVIKLAETGGLELKAASLDQDRGYRYYDRELRAEQLRQAREQPNLVEQMRRDLDRTEMGFTTLEFIRVALAKHEVSAKGRKKPIAFAPGMARIDHETGSMQYELSRGGAIIAYETRRGLANTLRGIVDAPLPSAEELASFRNYTNPPEL